MFFKKIKNNILLTLMFTLLIIPTYTLAYSDYILAGGENIGIELNSKGVIIVGTYEVNGKNPAKEAGIHAGDKITKINNKEVSSIEEMLNIVEKTTTKENIDITYLRAGKENKTTLKLTKTNDNIYKTGLYVKDTISGVGTLTYIDPNTKLFGALGKNNINIVMIAQGSDEINITVGVKKKDFTKTVQVIYDTFVGGNEE